MTRTIMAICAATVLGIYTASADECAGTKLDFQESYANHIGEDTLCYLYLHHLEVMIRYQEVAVERGCGRVGAGNERAAGRDRGRVRRAAE